MRKIIFNLTSIAVILFFGACSNQDEVLTDNNNEPVRTLSLTASMPESDPQTRVELNRNGKNIELTWVVGDVINLAYVQNGITRTSTATVASVSNGGKTADFGAITLPTDITAGVFDVYGVYGGGGITPNSTNAILTTNPGTAYSLNHVESRRDVMLYFASENYITDNDATASVSFQHLGSLFSITLKNNCTDNLNLKEARLQGITAGNENWAYNAGTGGNSFNLVNGTFDTTAPLGNFISFITDTSVLPAGGSEMTFWAWYPLLPNNNWPELKLVLENSSGELLTSVNSKPARQTPAVAGKNYHLYAEYDGTDLNFTNDAFVIPAP